MNGRPIALDQKLATGGEGAVFTLAGDQSLVAKIYHRSPTAQTAEKLSVMISLANPRLLSLAAWPKGLLFESRTRGLAGFVMPRLNDCQPIQHLYNPVQRLKSFQRAGWNFQVRAAANLAAAFDEVHKAGCLVGDVNQSNAQVSKQALVRLIDCDSFQVRSNGKAYLCEVGVAHYIPPELQGKSLRGLIRTNNHDHFGLAVLIYQLLFVGRHPYAGVYRGAGDPTFEQMIAEFRFAQGPMAQTWGMTPPPHTPTFADIPPELGMLFRRAFEPGSERGTRPRPTEWLSSLQRLEQAIVDCKDDSGHKYWSGAGSCVWCRLACRGGPEYYFGVAGGVGAFTVDELKLREILRRLSASGPFDFPYDRSHYAPAKVQEPEPLPDGLGDYRSTAIVLGLAIGICVLAMPFGLLHPGVCFGGFMGALIFGIWFACHVWLSPWQREYRRRRMVHNHALDDLDRTEENRSQTISRYRRHHSDLSQSMQGVISDCWGLASKYQLELQHVTANAEGMARTRHLRLHLIADAEIPKIGAGRKQILAQHNIFAAVDIEDSTIRNIKGFGEMLTNSLVAWKAEVLSQFRFDPVTGVSPAEQRSITVKYRNLQTQLFAELSRQITELESLTPSCKAALQKQIPALKRAVAQYEQAKADLYVFNELG